MKKIFAKNKFLKIASLLVVVFLITTCVIGTTFAKYTTGSSGSDTAKVAKWGIEVSASGALFGKNYGESSTIVADGTAGITVKAGADYNVVAPGTHNSVGFIVSISGTPEVSYKMTAAATNVKDIYLKAGSYGMMILQRGLNAASDVTDLYVLNDEGVYTKCADDAVWAEGAKYYALQDAVELREDYLPIDWELVVDGRGVAYDSLTDAARDLVNKTTRGPVGPGTEADSTYAITWSWPFGEQNDLADTMLGNIAAGTFSDLVKYDAEQGGYVEIESEDYSIEVGFEYNVVIEQVD